MTTSTFTTTHVHVQTEKQFGEVTKDFERQLGKFDPVVFQALDPTLTVPMTPGHGSRRWRGAAASCSSAPWTTGRCCPSSG